jgi:flagellar biosynthesis/type III secretory pathway protein FliH
LDKFEFKPLVKENKSENVADANFQSGLNSIFSTYKRPPVQQQQAAAQVERDNKKLEMEKQLAEARTKGYEEGYAKGYKDARVAADQVNQNIEQSLRAMVVNLRGLLEQNKLAEDKDIADVADVVVRIARKVSESALAANPVEAVEKVVRKSFKILFNEPTIIITVNHEILHMVQEKFIAMAKDEGFKGWVEVVGDNNVTVGSCLVNWGGGGLCSNKEEVLQQVDKMAKDLFVKKTRRADTIS